MQISKERLQDFIKLYEEEFEEQLSCDEASEITSRLIDLYILLSSPLPSEQNKEAALSLENLATNEIKPNLSQP